jgi:hypothetical protein
VLQIDRVALHLLRQAVASLKTISIKESFLDIASAVIKTVMIIFKLKAGGYLF